ncbi:MAG TPA: hypothetical protein VLQ89_03810 [Candidatus Binatia bacterium]|nr:hypothetical protein [Candidatus Binatia bacterium]
MKKIVLAILCIALFRPAFSFFPFFHGARSLALGYASLAFNYDVNAIYLNPALLNSFGAPMGGYQFASSYLDYADFAGKLQRITAADLKNFSALSPAEKSDLWDRLRDVFADGNGISGFQAKNPGYAGKGYGFAVEFIDAAVVFPQASAILDKPVAAVSDADIASLRMRFSGFHYTDYSAAVAVPLGRGVSLGAALHYLKGEASEFDVAVVDEPFRPASGAGEYLRHAWSGAEKGFSKVNFDLGLSAELGAYFKAGLTVKNAADPVIVSEKRELRLPRRVIAGLTFRPDGQFGISLDIDAAANDLYHTGRKVQPLSLGMEKGFFQNKFFLRAGFLNDLSQKYFFGRQAKIIYGLGLGFNLAKFLVDVAIGLDGLGHVKNLGVSGFYLIK